MTKLQASMRDASAKRRLEYRGYYKCGSCYKGCHNCGEWEMRLVGKRRRKFYTSGYSVMRSYHPPSAGWTYYCTECGAKDLRAWENAWDIGMDAIRGTREAVAAGKKYWREHWVGNAQPAVERTTTRAAALETPEITSLRAELARLKKLVGKEK